MTILTSDGQQYFPELDGGEQIKGLACVSADIWIPNEEIRNKEMFLRLTSVIHSDKRSGTENLIPLAKAQPWHVTVPRHLFPIEELERRKLPLPILQPRPEYMDAGFMSHENIVPRDPGQVDAWNSFSRADCGVLNLACGKGKTVMALKKIAQRNYPAIVIVNNTGLVEQWRERAAQFLGLSDDDIGIVQGKKEQYDRPLVLAMIQTLSNRAGGIPMDVRARFGTVIFDEVHHLSASKFCLTAPLFYGNRFGLTATPNREDGLEDVYYSHIGKIFHTDLKGDRPATIYFKRVDTQIDEGDARILDCTGEFSAGKMYKHMATLDDRNHAIADTVRSALSAERKVLVLVHSKEHPETLEELCACQLRTDGYTVGVVTSATPGKRRADIIRESDVTFATFGVAKEGLDAPELDTLIFATPFKAWGAFQQGKGRIERSSSGKREPLVVILDDFRVGPAHGMCKSLRRKIRENGGAFEIVGWNR